MLTLNLPEYSYKIIKEQNKLKIFDVSGRGYLTLTPEEWVRQHFIMFLVNKKNIPLSHIRTEAGIKLNGLQKRTDVLVYDKNMNPALLVECKSAEINLGQAVFEQINIYNMVLSVKYLAITNGMTHYYASIDNSNKSFNIINDLPMYENI